MDVHSNLRHCTSHSLLIFSLSYILIACLKRDKREIIIIIIKWRMSETYQDRTSISWFWIEDDINAPNLISRFPSCFHSARKIMKAASRILQSPNLDGSDRIGSSLRDWKWKRGNRPSRFPTLTRPYPLNGCFRGGRLATVLQQMAPSSAVSSL